MIVAGLVLLFAASLWPADVEEWLDVPYVRQSRDGCGAAAIAMVMQYWTRSDTRLNPADADDARIYSLLRRSAGKGIAGQDLKQYLEEKGYAAHVFNGSLGDLRDHIGKGRPLVACLAPRGSGSALHYVVVVGVSDTTVIFHDPARGKLLIESLGRFMRHWQPTDNWVLLATPRQQQ
jgi:predicted double-glycine peptidase